MSSACPVTSSAPSDESALTMVTSNPAKATTLAVCVAPTEVVQVSLDLAEPQLLDVAEVAADKAAQAWEVLRRPLVVDDGGLVVPALDGWPGAFTHPFVDAVGV